MFPSLFSLHIIIICLFLVFFCSSSSSSSLSFSPIPPPDGCTSILAGRLSTTSGTGALVTHSADCRSCDFRLVRIPASDYDPTAHRPVYPFRLEFPRFVGNRAPEYNSARLSLNSLPDLSWPETSPLGWIPQSEHTFGYLESVYAIQNEFGLSIGESTVAAKFFAKARSEQNPDGALFDVAELTRVALERSINAREAIHLMGALAEQFGFYGADGGAAGGSESLSVAGEALTIADSEESWVFHILPDDTGRSAIWAAQRLDDGEVTVLANAFSIGPIHLSQPDRFMTSANYQSVALRNGLWSPAEPFHFAQVYGHPVLFDDIYCARRIWRVFSLIAPSLALSPSTSLYDLPFSVRPDFLLSISNVTELLRDHYEGTQFDLTKGLAAGPFGNPNRYDRAPVPGADLPVLFQGTFERAISLARTSYAYIAQARSMKEIPHTVGARIFFAPAAPHASVFMPIYTAAPSVPAIYSQGSLYRLDRTSLWWASTAVGNYLERNYRSMIKEIQEKQRHFESKYIEVTQSKIEPAALDRFIAEKDVGEYYSTVLHSHSQEIIIKWWNLFEFLITKYHDGYRLDDFHAETIDPTAMFYPLDWLQMVGFFPQPVDWNRTDWYYTVNFNYSSMEMFKQAQQKNVAANVAQTNVKSISEPSQSQSAKHNRRNKAAKSLAASVQADSDALHQSATVSLDVPDSGSVSLSLFSFLSLASAVSFFYAGRWMGEKWQHRTARDALIAEMEEYRGS